MTDATHDFGGSKESPPKPGGFFDQVVHESTEATSTAEKVYVYQAPLRIWHWVNALCITVLCVTGYLIGEPPMALTGGEASDSFLFGYIRMTHFIAGQILALAFLGRIYWALVGNWHARQIFLLPFWSGKWWKEVFVEASWYSFLRKDPKKYIGHNPLAQIAMFALFVLPVIVAMCTGFALYAEGQGVETWWYAAFGWVFGLVGYDSFTVHTIHHITMWVIIVFTLVHIYAALREDIMSRQSMVSTMISGWRYFKDDRE